MGFNNYLIKLNSKHSTFDQNDLRAWFNKEGFEVALFTIETEHFQTDWLGEPLSFKLTKRPDFNTFYKAAYGGSLLVFECKIQEETLIYDCYSPIWIFGVWSKKLKFKEKTNKLTNYLQEGFEIEKKLRSFLS